MDPTAATVLESASACDRYAAQLDQSVADLTALRGRVAEQWTGTAGDSLCQALDGHVHSVKRAQTALRDAAANLRSAAVGATNS
jgi:uncharacterized protein YukE